MSKTFAKTFVCEMIMYSAVTWEYLFCCGGGYVATAVTTVDYFLYNM